MKITYFVNGELLEREAAEGEIPPPSEEELQLIEALNAERLKAEKRAAFQEEADPIFFKAQRGEATMEEWQAKIEEIRARFSSRE